MNQQQQTIMAHKFQSVLDADVLNERGAQLGFCQRQRLITPFRFGLSVIASMATEQVASLADLHRQFNDLWDGESTYKAFYNQVLKASCGEFLRTSLCDIMGKLTWKVLGFEAGHAFSAFNRLVIQDGSSFALHNALADIFPGRFNTVKPAAVELHCTMDLLQDAPITIVLSPDTDSEHAYLPEPESLRGDMFLADRGYLDLAYLRDIDRHGGFFLVRGKAGLNPRVLNAFREDGQRIKSCQDRDLQAIISKFPKRQRAELEVEWLMDHAPFRLRLIVSWNPETKSFDYLLTNLPPSQYISTRKAAMPSSYALPQLFRSLRHGDGPWYRRAFNAMIRYLGINATRAHPKRDARTGRSRLGLKPVFELSDHKAFMDNGEQPAAA